MEDAEKKVEVEKEVTKDKYSLEERMAIAQVNVILMKVMKTQSQMKMVRSLMLIMMIVVIYIPGADGRLPEPLGQVDPDLLLRGLRGFHHWLCCEEFQVAVFKEFPSRS